VIADPRLVTDGVRTKLTSLSLAVGDAQAPTGAPPYVVVYPIAGGRTSGPLAAPNDDAEMVFQVTCVGVSREQAEWLENKVQTGLLGIGTITVTGRSTPRIALDSFGGILRDDTTSQPLFMAVPRFRVYSTTS
jgi:hypothetical protein